jgi:hypothetical protein
MNTTLVRIFWSLVIHAVFLAVAVALILFIGGGEDAIADSVRARYADRPDQLDAVRSDAVWHLIQWAIYALSIGWLFSSLWLAIAERQMPTKPAEGAKKKGLWVLCLLADLAALAATGWVIVFKVSVQLDLAAGALTGGMMIVGVGTLLAYFLATGMCVKATMTPSVPFCGILPNFLRRKE